MPGNGILCTHRVVGIIQEVHRHQVQKQRKLCSLVKPTQQLNFQPLNCTSCTVQTEPTNTSPPLEDLLKLGRVCGAIENKAYPDNKYAKCEEKIIQLVQ